MHQLLLNEEDTFNVSSVVTSDSSSTPPTRYMSLVLSLNANHFQYHLLHWIIKEQLPFTTVENENFKSMMLAISLSVGRCLVGKSTIRTWVNEEFARAQLEVGKVLAEAVSKIHISFDLWASPNGYAIYAVCAHFIGSDHHNHSVLLGLKRMTGTHHGEDIVEVIISILHIV
jgi:hypothetical protein